MGSDYRKEYAASESQSLIHQVIYSVFWHIREEARATYGVSIPYSSGHLFRSFSSLFLPQICSFVSQSLIHQVIYSVRPHTERSTRLQTSSLNPLFIRSSIPFFCRDYALRKDRVLSQSLIHQVIYSVGVRLIKTVSPTGVSIPYSSGHLFR